MEASGGKEAPASLLLSLNGVGDSDGSVAENFKKIFRNFQTFNRHILILRLRLILRKDYILNFSIIIIFQNFAQGLFLTNSDPISHFIDIFFSHQ